MPRNRNKMRKKLSIWCVVLIVLALQIPTLLDGHRSRRRGSIAAALQDSSTHNELFVKEEPLKVASIDKLSLSFEDTTKEIPKEQRDPTRIKPKPAPIKNVFIEPEPPTPAQITHGQTIQQQTTQYALPKELQQKAKEDLAKLQVAPPEQEKIELQFEDADLLTFVKQIADIFKVTFISDDALDPLPKGTSDAPTKALKGNKISFKTTTPISKQEAWNLFISFLNISGFSIVPQPDPTIYRIQTIKSSHRAPLATFIGVNYETLPENDEIIRYLYFVENASLDAMRGIIPSLQSTSAAAPIWLNEQKAFILTDKSYNIRSLMAIVKELDKVTMPQAMSVLKLRQADADEVKKLYDELTSQTDTTAPFRPFGARKQPTAIFFPESAKIIAEPRTNSLILLGPKDAIAKIEDFIVKHVDVALDQPYSPLYTHQLQYADAKTIAEIMNTTTKLGQDTEVGKAGGVRGKDKYLKSMSFTAEPSTNKLIIKADYNDYLVAKQVIESLDQPQPQVALDVLILSVRLIDNKEIGTQIRSKVPGLDGILGQNVKFQTSGLRAGGAANPIVTNPSGSGVDRLLGNLISLVTQATTGNTIVTFGQDLFGVWGLFQALRTITNVQVISNPFLFAANKTPATVSLGETRRVVTGTIEGTTQTQTFGDEPAELKVDIIPQINSDGMIILELTVNITEFTSSEVTDARRTTKKVKTQAIVADGEVLALGGLIRNTETTNISKTPVLGDIPLLGWLFKNKRKALDKDSLLILISTKIIPPHATSDINQYTKDRLNTYRSTMGEIAESDTPKDPIHKLFFADKKDSSSNLGEFIFDRHQRARRRKKSLKRKDAQDVSNNPSDQGSLQLAQSETRQSRRRRRGRKTGVTEISAPIEQPITITQSPTLTTIAAPSVEKEQRTPVQLSQKKRRSRSLSSFLTPNESEKVA